MRLRNKSVQYSSGQKTMSSLMVTITLKTGAKQDNEQL